MRNLLALLGAAVVTFAGAGWYLGWYTLTPTPSSGPGHQGVTIDFDGKKFDADLHKGEQKVEQALERAAHHDDTAKQAKSPGSPPAKSPQ
jgi:hypothetical protein